ncbi:MAG: glycosyltransferase family 9 protein [Verrucomicrobia bacterium]|nr:glycosyltransferase family 9 protein [Verrucomicrobiota bacterium]
MRFLIVKMSAFGDVVQAYPVLHYLKSRFPEAKIDWVIEKRLASLVRAHPLVDTVLEVDAKAWKKRWWSPSTFRAMFQFGKRLTDQKYDVVFDLQSNSKSAIVTFLSRAKAKVGFGWKTASERINCCITKFRANPPKGQNIRRDYLFIVQQFFKDSTVVPIEAVSLRLTQAEEKSLQEWKAKIPADAWMICPGSYWENKKISKETLEAFLRASVDRYHPFFVFLAGSEAEKSEVELLASQFEQSLILDRPELPLLQHLMKEMKLVIAMDSFPLHLAGTCAVPTFSIFGPTVGFKFRPLGKRNFTVQGSCPYGEQFEKRCSKMKTCKTGACMRQLDPEPLFTKFSHWWGNL